MNNFSQMDLFKDEYTQCLAEDCGPSKYRDEYPPSTLWMAQSGVFLVVVGLVLFFWLRRKRNKFWMLSLIPILAAAMLLIAYFFAAQEAQS